VGKVTIITLAGQAAQVGGERRQLVRDRAERWGGQGNRILEGVRKSDRGVLS
jgi:hypothetical protein